MDQIGHHEPDMAWSATASEVMRVAGSGRHGEPVVASLNSGFDIQAHQEDLWRIVRMQLRVDETLKQQGLRNWCTDHRVKMMPLLNL